ncbi:HET-C-related protein [Apibacter adventoris]|uniref:Heterokaryon incompatibility protein Het-C n=1 Tax=Apibacter adventoris TaxID=1679466 RepID=A0A2S8A8Q0_9FLAO|nr:HET-C-related protein [Apibacter adventoris]PQL90955.1 hypothetical protein C4S77_08825 [Apibacter adventoris]
MGTIKRVIGKKSVHIAKNINIWATEGNVTFNAAKKVAFHGEQNGVVYGKYQPPDLRVVESEYKLKSTYAHEQLSQLARELDEVSFICFLIGIFGEEIEISAYSKLYRGLSDQSIPPPEILVTRMPVRGWKACYSNKRKKILVWEHFIDQAIKDNDSRGELMAALVEEYGHHIDNLLRTELATNGKKDQDILDEGAKFAYQLFQFDIFNETHLSFARAQTPNYSGDLVIDFSELNRELQAYVGEDQWYDADPLEEDFEGFGAGFEPGSHGAIEMEALYDPINLFTKDDIRQIYYGNWLRDYSQVIIESAVHLPDEEINRLKNSPDEHMKNLVKTNPMKLSHEGWLEILRILAAKEFVYEAESGESKFVHQYKNYVDKFEEIYGPLDRDVLGIYRPEEHIDNPMGLKDFSSLSISCLYEYEKGILTEKRLYAGEKSESLAVDTVPTHTGYAHMLKSYIHKNIDADRPSADAYMSQQLKLAVQYGKNRDGFRHLGAALHVLEDYFSHSNFIELALMKAGFKNIYPWVEGMQGKDYTTIPIVTGKFLTDDTLASILPKMADKMFPVGIQKYEQRKPKDRTFTDAFILTTLEDLSTNQKSDGEPDPTYAGMTAAEWLNKYDLYLKMVDIKASGVDALGGVGRFIDRGISYMGDALATFVNIGFNFFLSTADIDIKEEQTLHSNRNYGTNPTHTQLAKDSHNHPLNPLAADLAKVAIRDVAQRIIEIWRTGSDPTGEKLAQYVINKYTIHPKSSKTDWAIEMVEDWGNKNQDIIKRLESATVYEHVHNETKRAIESDTVQKILKYFN